MFSLHLQFIRTIVLGSTLLFLTQTGAAQLAPSSRSVPNPSDARFQGVEEDWTTPALNSSHLRAIRPVEFVTDGSGYTVELLQAQWRSGDPIDLYVMKPKGVKKPPVILYLYGYPTDTDIFKRDAYQELVTRDRFAAVGFVSTL